MQPCGRKKITALLSMWPIYRRPNITIAISAVSFARTAVPYHHCRWRCSSRTDSSLDRYGTSLATVVVPSRLFRPRVLVPWGVRRISETFSFTSFLLCSCCCRCFCTYCPSHAPSLSIYTYLSLAHTLLFLLRSHALHSSRPSIVLDVLYARQPSSRDYTPTTIPFNFIFFSSPLLR